MSRGASEDALRRLTLYLADLDGGGAERMMVAIANGMARRGVTVDLVVADPKGPYRDEVSSAVNLVDLGSAGVAKSLPALVRYLRRERPQALLTTLPHSSLIALAARSLAGTRTPVIVREANTPTRARQPWESRKMHGVHWLMQRAYPFADGVIAVSAGVADALRTVVGLKAEAVRVLYNPIVTAELRAMADEVPDHPWLAGAEGQPVVLGVGSLTARKDFATLIAAFAEVRRARPCRLVILGEGPERANLQALAVELGVAEDLALPGFVPNPFGYMARADVYVLSSQLEGLPGTLVQAIACGCPPVATDCPSGPREVLEDGRLGPLVAVGDARGMAAAIEAQLTSPTPEAELKAASLRYDADTVLGATYEYLREFI